MKKGFTLVELLAVIVILAIIALITIPAVMKMIDTSTMNSYRRSIDLYGKAVSNGIISYESDMVEKGKKIDVSFQNIMDYIEYEGNDVECNRKIIYSDKTILLTECSVEDELVYGEKGRGYGDDNYYYYTNSKKKMKLIEYIEAVEEAIQDKNISGTCTIGEDKITCNGEDINVRSNLENAIEGTITIENNKVKSYANLKFATEKKIVKTEEIPEVIDEQNTNNNNQMETNNIICKSKTGTLSTELGTEYECELKEGTKYNFYVLSKEGDKINLIMDRNICEDGSLATSENPCHYQWHDYDDNSFGPTIIFEKVYNATKNWSNIPDIDLNYSDEGNLEDSRYGYGKVITTENSIKITKKDGTESKMILYDGNKKLKARLPMKKEVSPSSSALCTEVYGSCPGWLINNLAVGANHVIDVSHLYPNNTNIPEILGYWTMSSGVRYNSGIYDGISVNHFGTANENTVSSLYAGIRPVITVLMSNLLN